MKNIKLIKIFFLFVLAVILQINNANAQNLVPNPSFEEYDYCWPEIGAIMKDWDSYSGSPDYFHVCVNSQFGVPNNSFGYQEPVSGGAAYCGIYVYNNYLWSPNPDTTYREMIGAELLSPLIIGRKYYISFNVSLSSYDFCASNNIGVLFSTTPHIDTSQTFSTWIIQNYSHINNYTIITDTINWNTVRGDFVADSAYRYIIVGNFFNNYNTDILITNNDSNCQIYYYIDDVCVSEDSTECDFLLQNTIVNSQSQVKIYPNPTEKYFNIDIQKLNNKENVHFELYNAIGKLVLFKVLTATSTEVNTEYLKTGVYFIKIYIGDKLFVRKLFINN